MREPLLLVAGDRLLRGGGEVDAVGAVDGLRDLLDLRRDRLVVGVEHLEVRLGLRGGGDDLGELDRALPTLAEAVVDRGAERTGLERARLDQLEQLGLVVGARVDRDDRLDPERADVLDVLREVRHARLDLGRHLRQLGLLAPVAAAVVAERAHGRDDHDDVRLEAADAADDVHELLHPEVGGEARLGDHELAQLERDPVGDDASCCRGRCSRTARRA